MNLGFPQGLSDVMAIPALPSSLPRCQSRGFELRRRPLRRGSVICRSSNRDLCSASYPNRGQDNNATKTPHPGKALRECTWRRRPWLISAVHKCHARKSCTCPTSSPSRHNRKAIKWNGTFTTTRRKSQAKDTDPGPGKMNGQRKLMKIWFMKSPVLEKRINF